MSSVASGDPHVTSSLHVFYPLDMALLLADVVVHIKAYLIPGLFFVVMSLVCACAQGGGDEKGGKGKAKKGGGGKKKKK